MTEKVTVPRIDVTIRRDAHTTTATQCMPYELHILRHQHGKENVIEVGATDPIDVAPEAEYERLIGKYGPENVIKVYGEDEGLRLSGMVRAEAEKFAKAEAAKAKKSAAAAA